MSKKQKKINANLALSEKEKQNKISEGVIANEKSNKIAKNSEQNSKNKKEKKNKEVKEKKGLVRKTKETISELKKVTWPSFGEVVKKTGIVVAFVLIFGVFIFGVNTLLGGLVNLLMGNPFLG